MNKYEKGFKRYRRFIEGMSGWETVYAGYGYETFVFMCKRSKTFRERWMTDEIIVKYLERHMMIWV